MSNITLAFHPEDSKTTKIVGSWLREFLGSYEPEPDDGPCAFGPVNMTTLSRSNIENIINTNSHGSIDIIAYYGHGTRCSLSLKGDEYVKPKTNECDDCGECKKLPTKEALFDAESIKHMDGKEIYTVACKSAKKLGDDLTDYCQNDTAFFGYDGRLDLPGYLPQEIKNHLKEIVNYGLELLHRSGRFDTKLERYQAVTRAVIQNLFILGKEIRKKGEGFNDKNKQKEYQGFEMCVHLWRRAFKPACKIGENKYTIENIFDENNDAAA